MNRARMPFRRLLTTHHPFLTAVYSGLRWIELDPVFTSPCPTDISICLSSGCDPFSEPQFPELDRVLGLKISVLAITPAQCVYFGRIASRRQTIDLDPPTDRIP